MSAESSSTSRSASSARVSSQVKRRRALGAVEIEPGEVLELLRQLRMELFGKLRIVRGHGGAAPPAAAVREQRQVAPGLEPGGRPLEVEEAELDEMVATSGGAELRP